MTRASSNSDRIAIVASMPLMSGSLRSMSRDVRAMLAEESQRVLAGFGLRGQLHVRLALDRSGDSWRISG
jgi:hypothetical protein